MENKLFSIIGAFTGVLILLAVIGLILSIETVGPGERGVYLVRNAVQDEIKQPGWHFITPFVSNIVNVDVQTQKVEVQADSASKDLQQVSATVALNYYPDTANVNQLYRDTGKKYDERIIAPALQEAVKAATAEFTAEELITKRPEVSAKIKEVLTERLNKNHIVVGDFSIVNFTFSEEFNRSIESKQTAEQDAKRAENDLIRIEVEAKQTITKANADAESIRIQGKALKETPGLVELKAVEKWNGALPQYSGGGAVPFINIQ